MARAGSQELRAFGLICALLLSSSLANQTVRAEDGSSLIESALDGKYTPAPESSSKQTPAATAEKVKAAQAAAVKAEKAAAKAAQEAAKAVKAAQPRVPVHPGSTAIKSEKPVVIFQKPKAPIARAAEPKEAEQIYSSNKPTRNEPAWSDSEYPAPKEIIVAPIHSKLPSGERKLLGVPLGVTVGKSFPIDPTYRGKPTLPETPTVSFGAAPWAIPAKKQLAATPAASVPLPANAVVPLNAVAVPKPGTGTSETAKAETLTTVNFRFKTLEKVRFTDSIWAYPYPPKPPKQVINRPLSEEGPDLKNRILQHGYTYRPDLSRPYPAGGWRWVLAFDNGMKKSGTGYPHTMLTMYPWVNKVLPYILSECHEFNLVEQKRSENYNRVIADYERVHTDIEAQATARGLQPIEIKVNGRGVAQQALPPGNWWLAATRKSPGLKFYWQIPITCLNNATEPMNVQLTEANALIVAGGW